MFLRQLIVAAAFSVAASAAQADPAAVAKTIETLQSGHLSEGAAALGGMIAAGPANDDARFGLGMVRFVQAIEHLAQGLYRYGLQPPRSVVMPILRLPVPENPNPEPIDYDKFRELLLAFDNDLAAAESTMAGMGNAGVKIPVNLITVHYDANGDGQVDDTETLTAALGRFLDVSPEDIAAGPPMTVAFDRADAYWLRGYCLC